MSQRLERHEPNKYMITQYQGLIGVIAWLVAMFTGLFLLGVTVGIRLHGL